ncbi:hypothetical protein MKX54_03815 [Alkalihalobacillus sp. FSL R5-0424]
MPSSKDSIRRFIMIMVPAFLVNLIFMLTLPGHVRMLIVFLTYTIAMIVFFIWTIVSKRKKQT